MPDLGQMIKEKREAIGLSQKKLGATCGLSDSEIMKIESGIRKKPSWVNLCKIAKVLKFHPFEILLVAGYISETDINPCNRICGLGELNDKEIETVQVFVDFLISRKGTGGISRGGQNNAV